MKKLTRTHKSLFLRMLSILLTCIAVISVSPSGAFGQAVEKRITIDLKNTPVRQIIYELRKQSGMNFMFEDSQIDKMAPRTLQLKNVSIEKALDELLKDTEYTYKITGNSVAIVRKVENKQVEGHTVSGVVTDKNGDPLVGVTIVIKGTYRGTTTNIDGKYSLAGIPADATLIFTFIGMDSREVAIEGRTVVDVQMKETATEIEGVVVTGMFTRRAESFTGSSTTFKQEELKAVGNQNLLKSLSVLDPSFQIAENLEMGSNPNSLPNIQLRGETSFNVQGDYEGNANQPLFILDGFETTLEKVFDLDMNRVESITLLKDAAAKAIYGSKAGNGVVVIQTIRPKSGEVRITYNGDVNIQAPDLKDYNLMNAQEKFDWEIAHHKYDNWQAMNSVQGADNLYKSVYDAIASGVDTYWLAKPLRVGVGQKHSLSLEGGDERIRYILSALYNDVKGVMKGSDRSTFNINNTLSYTYKNIIFRNQMDYSRNVANESPYGLFSEYIGLEPYFAPYDSDGKLKKLLGQECANDYYPVYNPLYNASLNTKNRSAYTAFTENFEMDWHINGQFRLTAQFSYSRTEESSDVFYPSGHTMFIDYDANGIGDRKGRYTKTDGYSNKLSAQAGLNYNQSFGRHFLFFNGTWNLQTVESGSTTTVAEGFGNDSMDDISMATSYFHDSRPGGSDSKTREIGIIGAFNYSFDDRYLFDASFRASGSSVYGSDNHWGNFWSLGAGWNIHKEHFIPKNWKISMLKLRYSLGYTGTQNFNPYQARAKYQYGNQYYDGRLGTTILGIPNTKLKWQKIYDNNFGIDIAWNNVISARAEYYIQNTDNMLTDITLPASTGFNTYKENMGKIENKGYEISLSITPWRNNKDRAWLTLTASAYHNKNTIKKIYDIFKKSNDDADDKLNAGKPNSGNLTAEEIAAWKTQTTRPATKYYEGCSMTAIWGVRSLGIDPMSGKEMFLDKDGNLTYTWSSDDQVVIGDSNPKLRGTVGLSAGWKGFTLSMTASYKLGGDLYNSTLIERVENVTGFGNLDKRVAQTWTKPGDHAPYKLIEMRQNPNDSGETTRPTSRFVQKNNELYFSSVNFGYDFYRMKFVKKIGLERLKLTFYADEIARLSTVKIERGTSYPFARTFSLSLNATF